MFNYSGDNIDIIRQLPGLFYMLDKDSNHVMTNDDGAQLMGFNKFEDAIGIGYSGMNNQASEHAELFKMVDSNIMQHNATHKTISYFPFPTGEWRLLIGEKKSVRDQDGSVSGTMSTWHDITNGNLIDLASFLARESKDKYSFKQQSFCYEITGSNSYDPFDLSTRELEVLFYLLRGSTAKKISDNIYLSQRTVEGYIDNLKYKFGCKNKSELIENAIVLGYMTRIPDSIINKITSV